MRHLGITKQLGLALLIASAPVHASAGSPSAQDEPTAEESSWLASASASRLAGNGRSVDGRTHGRIAKNGVSPNGRRINGTSLGGHTIRTDGGMTVVSIQLPGAERHSK